MFTLVNNLTTHELGSFVNNFHGYLQINKFWL